MLKTDLVRTAAAIMLTVVASATCVFGAIAPAQTPAHTTAAAPTALVA